MPGVTIRRRPPGAEEPGVGRWRRWSYELTPDGPDATMVTEIYDCSRAPQDARTELDCGNVFIESVAKTLNGLTPCSPSSAVTPGIKDLWLRLKSRDSDDMTTEKSRCWRSPPGGATGCQSAKSFDLLG
jgi:hypothetical protein